MTSSPPTVNPGSGAAPTPPACAERSLVDAHFAGTIAPRDERRMREHLIACERCRARYRRHQILAELDPAAVPAEERIARGLGLRRPRALRVVPIAASILALAAAILLVLRPSGDPTSSSFTPRGSVSSLAADRTSKIGVYRVGPDGDTPVPATQSIQHNDELAFTYTSGEGKTHLMIFGVDERGRVYWFHPAWSSEAETPQAVAIEADGQTHELREAIRHRFEGERLEIHGLFLDHPITVLEAEAAVRARPSHAGEVTVPGGTDHVILFETRPR